MSTTKKILLPDIGDFEAVEIIEIPVKPGDSVAQEDPLMTLESDKASMDIPCPENGVIKEISVKVGDKVSAGDLILLLETSEQTRHDNDTDNAEPEEPRDNTDSSQETQAAGSVDNKHSDKHCEVVVLGGGPGGYTAAFRSADLGKQTLLIERHETLGGVCLNVGCIPSKALLHIARVIAEVEELKEHGLHFSKVKTDPKLIRRYAVNTIGKLTTGLKTMAAQRNVEVLRGNGKFIDPNTIEVEQPDGSKKTVSFQHAIIAAGSQPATIPSLPDDPRIMDSTSALLLDKIPSRLLIVGGGIIGLEMATIYQALGAKITVVEMLDNLIAGCDKDIVRPLHKHIKKRYENIYLKTAVKEIKATKNHLQVTFDGAKAPGSDKFDAILVAVGRRPNGQHIGAENIGINVNEQGFIPVDDQQHTNHPHIFAIGDIVGQPMLAHKATHEGKIAAEVIAGMKHGFDNRVIPSVAYTDPEIAWVGMTETDAKAQGMDFDKGIFPWAASGRALSVGRAEGITKLLFDKSDKRIIGAAMVGPNAGELIAECTLAIEMGADPEDIGLTIHPHPTLSETVGLAAEAFEGTITDLYMPKKS